MKKVITSVVTALVVILVISGSVAAVSYTDDLGRTVDIPDKITHVIPSGSLAQTVLLSFDPSYLVSLCSNYDENALKYVSDKLKDLPNTGSQFTSKRTMSDEEIMKLAKELGGSESHLIILDTGQIKNGMGDTMDQLQSVTGVPFLFVTQDIIDDIPVSYQKIGKLLGAEGRGEELSSYTQSVIDRFNEGMAKVGDKKKTMIYVTRISGNSVNVMGSGNKSTFHTSVIDNLATNIAPAATSGAGIGNELTMEDIMQLNPDIIIVNASGAESHDYYNTIMSDSKWSMLSAVINGNVYEAPMDSPMNWMGQPPSSLNKLVSMIWLGKVFYPEVFTYDLKTEIQKFYKVMLNYDMSDDNYATLTKYSVTPAKKTAASPFPFLGIIAGIGAAVLLVARKR